jgi:hypothetical protein
MGQNLKMGAEKSSFLSCSLVSLDTATLITYVPFRGMKENTGYIST